MEVLGNLAGGFATALQPINIAFLLVGVVLGLIIGVLPGLGGTSGVAILLPISVVIARGDIPGATSTTAVILLAGIYWGALFGGVITSILFNIPGEPWSVVLLFDGFPLAKRKGKPGVALASSFFASFEERQTRRRAGVVVLRVIRRRVPRHGDVHVLRPRARRLRALIRSARTV